MNVCKLNTYPYEVNGNAFEKLAHIVILSLYCQMCLSCHLLVCIKGVFVRSEMNISRYVQGGRIKLRAEDNMRIFQFFRIFHLY